MIVVSEKLWFQKYKVIKRLGRGGSAEVFLAEHCSLAVLRAIKRIPRTEKLHDFWIREAAVLKNLSHPQIPVIYDLEQDESYSYIIMEYLEGVSLKVYRNEHDMTLQEIQKTALQICSILVYLHELEKPLLYLDLKPENLIMCKDGSIKLVDFGAAVQKNEWKKQGVSIGTKGYAAPELFEGKEPDERSDIYSFGMLLFFLFTNEAPKRANRRIGNIDRIRGIEPGWKDIVNRCLKYLPPMRFSSATALENTMNRLLQKEIGREAKKKGGCLGEKRMAGKSCRVLRVAGTEKNSGSTHLCLMLAAFYANEGKCVAYREIQENGVVETLLLQNRAARFQGMTLLRGEEQAEVEQFDVEIQDYGWIKDERHSKLFDLAGVLLVTGGRCWEVGVLESILRQFGIPPLICMNFVSGKDFLQLAKIFHRYCCIRIPYQPEIFGDFSGQVVEFAQRIWEEADACLEKRDGSKEVKRQ